ncbi:TonB-dependent receptor plug domain-containing protein [Hyphomonas sp.]|uniref:TonB-dependent receptor plug domain-containing protein n=1 Tax=Hyphomonas sp. TaxID=87 RepID=UPI003D2E41DA
MSDKHTLLRGISLAAFCLGSGITAHAQVAEPAETVEPAAPIDAEGDPIMRAETVVVQGYIGYRDRTDDTVQTLTYGQDYFQRFEPLTAGDALKRVPSVTFLSDVIESDGARLRGLDPGYTQILINGEKVPGSNADRSFFMDRIPAELIDRVEIVRGATARRSGDAVAGTLNIVLRDGYELDGGYIRAGALRFDDGEVKPSFGGVYGGAFGPGRILLGANVQGRYNPKLKSSLRYGDSPENDPDYRTSEFDNREDQTDTRDGTDYSFNSNYQFDRDGTRVELDGFFVYTDRTEDERSFEYDIPTGVSGPLPDGNLLTDNANVANIEQTNYSVKGKFAQKWSAGETKFKLAFASFDEQVREFEEELDFDVDYDDGEVPVIEGESVRADITDEEFSAELAHEFEFSDTLKFEAGIFFQTKQRDTDISAAEDELDLDTLTGYDQFSETPTQFGLVYADFEAEDGGLSSIEEDRIDIFAVLNGEVGNLDWEAGLRYETTDVSINDRTVDADLQNQSNDYATLLPSAHIKYDATSLDRFTASVARTVRRPNFNFVSPVLLTGEYGDSDLLGNPQLDPENAWGLDVGYERRIGKTGVFGVNVFYRDVKDLIEVVNTGAPSDDYCDEFEDDEGFTCDQALAGDPAALAVYDPNSFVLTPENVGDGQVYGIEFDLSTSLVAFGMENTGVFANLSLLDSKIDDFIGERRFNSQSEYVYNFGFIQELPVYAAAFGVTYRKQGDAYERINSEEVTTSYGADLEIFVEKSIGDSFTIRAVGSNLLNASKDEVFNKFDNEIDQMDRDFDEYELETEEAGPVFQIMARYAF